MTEGQRLALQAGIGHEKEFVRFWRRLARGTGERGTGERGAGERGAAERGAGTAG